MAEIYQVDGEMRRGGWRIVFSLLTIGAILAPSPSTARAADRNPVSRLPLNRGVGQRLGNFTLQDAVSGRSVEMHGNAGRKAVVLVFLGTDCPLANLYAPRLAELEREYRGKGVVFLGINSNARETVAQMAEQARRSSFEFPILKDVNNVVADLALVERTPEIVVLDRTDTVRYRGAIDDQYAVGARKDKPAHQYLRDALDALLAKRNVAVPATAAVGCLLDRVEPKKQATAGAPRIRPASPELTAAHEEAEGKAAIEVGDVTYASAAARIIQEKCQSCHRPGQVAPFSLLTYDDARKHAAMIHEVVDNRRMPPWHADPQYGHFSNDRSLSPRERAALLSWVEQGAPLGDPKAIPPDRAFPGEWTIGKPDMVIEIPEPYVVPAQGVVEYVRFRISTKFTEDRWIQAAEAQPGDRPVVHHIVVYVEPKPDKEKKSIGGLAHLCAYAPGDLPTVYAPGTAKRIPAGADLIVELHYTPIGTTRIDRSRLGLIFAKTPVNREAHTVAIVGGNINIPPHQDNVPVEASLVLPRDVRLLSLFPHMHLRGKNFKYTMTRPGKPAEILLSIPAYDFGWQSYYQLAEPMCLPKGTRIDCLAHYDNSEKNPYNPDPSKTVRWGEQTYEEMMIGYIDIDLPVGASFSEEPPRPESSRRPADPAPRPARPAP